MPNAPFIAQNTLTQLRTHPREFALMHNVNATIVTTSANRSPVSTAPVHSTANGRFVIPSEGMNYMKLMPIWQNQTGGVTITSPNVKVTGWHFDGNNNLYIPVPIADVIVTPNTYATFSLSQVSGSPLMNVSTALVLQSGDAKLYQSSPTGLNGAAICVDTWGAQMIEVEFRATSVASAPVANCWYASV